MTFAQKAKKIMKQRGITQNELARRAGLSSSGICTTLSDNGNPRESSMMAIYEALDMTPEEFWSDVRPVDSLTKEQSHLISIFDQLNSNGKTSLMEIAESLLRNDNLRQEGSISSAI